MPPESDLPNLTLLIKLLKMTTAANDGEVLNAIRMANTQLLKFGGDWERLLRGKVTVIGADPFERIPEPPIATRSPPQPQSKPYTPTRGPIHHPPQPPRPAQPPNTTNASQNRQVPGFFDDLEFVSLQHTTQIAINNIWTRWKLNHYLDLHDFAFLQSTATANAPKSRRRTTSRS